MADNEWLTQEEIANQLNVPVEKIRSIVSVLSGPGVIRTQRNPLDKRYVLVHRTAIETIRQSIFGA